MIGFLAHHWQLAALALLLVACCVMAPQLVLATLRALLGTATGRWLLLVLALGAGLWVQTARLDEANRSAAASAWHAGEAALHASEAARVEEQTRTRYLAGVANAYERGQDHARVAVAGVLDAVARGDYVLRDSLRCPVRRPAVAPAAQAGPADAADPAAGVLPPDVVRSLVRSAGEADDVSARLRLCDVTLDALLGVAKADRAQVTP